MSLEAVRERAASWRADGAEVVVVMGLGFVGSAVAAVLAGASRADGRPAFGVIGLDLPTPIGQAKVDALNAGRCPVTSTDATLDQLVARGVGETGNLVAIAGDQVLELADVIVMDIPLDVQSYDVDAPGGIQVELDGFRTATRRIGQLMRPDALVLVETTVPVGVTERVVAPVLAEERAARGIDAPALIAHCFERVMPGPRYVESIRRFWRAYAGIDAASAARCRAFLERFIDTSEFPLVELETPGATELAKLLENSYRAANIAFIHEWTLMAERMGLDLFAIVEAIRVRRGTHDNIRYPGLGVGGYCLTKDSMLAQWGSEHLYGLDATLPMTLEALRINRDMPLHTVELVAEVCPDGVAGKTVAICGVSYLPDVADTRQSPAGVVLDALGEQGAAVRLHDPLVDVWGERPEATVSPDLAATLEGADGAVLAVGHRVYRELQTGNLPARREGGFFIVDAMNVIDDAQAAAFHQAGCRVIGVGKGHWRRKNYHR